MNEIPKPQKQIFLLIHDLNRLKYDDQKFISNVKRTVLRVIKKVLCRYAFAENIPYDIMMLSSFVSFANSTHKRGTFGKEKRGRVNWKERKKIIEKKSPECIKSEICMNI